MSSQHPARVKWGWELQPLRHFAGIHGNLGLFYSARPLFMRRHRKRSNYSRKRTSIFDSKSPQALLGSLRWPKEAHQHPKEKKSPLGPRRPKGTHQHPNGAKGRPESSQGKQNEPQRHSKESDQSQNYINIKKIYLNSLPTAIQRPASIMY